MARPSKLDSRVQDTICEALREGASLAVACARAGVGTSTALEWLARGRGAHARRRARRRYVAFVQAVEAAQDHNRPGPGLIRANQGESREFAEIAEPGFSDAVPNARAREDEPTPEPPRPGFVWPEPRTGLADYDF
jgi:hypothetical protein